MNTLCPKCGFEGSIIDDKALHPGQTVECPKCKERFQVETTTAQADNIAEKDTADITPEQKEPEPPPDSDHNQHHEIEFPYPSSSEPPKRTATLYTRFFKDKGFNMTNMVILSIAILSALSIGFFAGRATKTTPQMQPALKIIEKKEIQKKPIIPENVAEKQPIEEEKNKLIPIPIPSPSLSNPDENSEIIAKGIDWDNYASDDYFNITEIDNMIKDWRESDLTKIQKEIEAKRYAETFLGKNLNGYFIIKIVRKRYFDNTDFPGGSDSFPDESYVYVIKVISAMPVSKREHELCDVLIGIKETDNIIQTLRKGNEIFVEGIIYSWKASGGTYDIYLINSKVKLIN